MGSSDGKATVKTLKIADGLILHHPAYSPMIADNAVIVGEVVTVLRGALGACGPPGRRPPSQYLRMG